MSTGATSTFYPPPAVPGSRGMARPILESRFRTAEQFRGKFSRGGTGQALRTEFIRSGSAAARDLYRTFAFLCTL